MEFPFYVSKVLPAEQDGIVILDAASLHSKSSYLNSTSYPQAQTYSKLDTNKDCLVQIIDKMGQASSIAQGLGAVITTYSKFASSGDNRLYIKISGNKVCGILKVGKRNLFYYDGTGKVKELRPLCVLDFYVHESTQRSGIGKILFEKMLAYEKVEPQKLAYDRPSPKLIGFLKKHYGLVKYIPQNNNFVIFNQYWEETTPTSNALKQKERGFQQYEDSKDRNPYYNKSNSQTEFHKVGKSILENNPATSYYKQESSGYQRGGGSLPQSSQNIQSYGYLPPSGMNNTRSLEDINRTTMFGKREENNRLSSREQVSHIVDPQQTQGYGGSYNQILKNQYSRPPWGSFGTDMNSYKTSGAYGNYYAQQNPSYLRK